MADVLPYVYMARAGMHSSPALCVWSLVMSSLSLTYVKYIQLGWYNETQLYSASCSLPRNLYVEVLTHYRM